MVIKLWIAVAIQLQGTRMIKRHMHRSTNMLKRLGHINDQLYEAELAILISNITNHRSLQHTIRRIEYVGALLKLLFFTKFRDADKYEEMEVDTDSLYLALAIKEFHDCIRSAKMQVWEMLSSKDYCFVHFTRLQQLPSPVVLC